MTNSDLSILISFLLNNSPKDASIQDITDYSTLGITENAVMGAIKATDPNGDVFYFQENFRTPDIDFDNSAIGDTKTGIFLPLDTKGIPLTGLYSFEYTARIYNTLVANAITDVDQSNKYFYVAGDKTANINATECFYVSGSTGNDNGYTVSASEYLIAGPFTGKTQITVNETIASAIADGNFNLYSAYDEYTNTSTYNFCFLEPDVDIHVSSDCNTSTLISRDDSDYIAYCNGVAIQPDTISRTHTVRYPDSLLTPIIDIENTNKTITISPIYTKTWVSIIETVLTYTLPDGGSISTTVRGSVNHDVQCDDCQCEIYQCIVNLRNAWLSKLGVNQVETERLELKLQKILTDFMLYNMAVKCGESTDTWCNSIKAVAESEGCSCTTENNEISVEVIPISAGTGSGDVSYYNVWHDGSGEPSSLLGNNNDYYLCTADGVTALEGDVYKKLVGSWVLQFNLKGTAGGAGPAGDDGVAVLHNDFNTVALTATGVWTDMSSYTMPANTLDTNGSYIRIEGIAVINNLLSSSLKGTQINIGAVSREWYNSSAINTNKVDIKVHRVDASTALIELVFARSTTPTSLFTTLINSALDFTNPIDITFAGASFNPVFANNDVENAVFTITHYKK